MTLADCKPGAIVRVWNREALLYFVQAKNVNARWLDGDREHAVFSPAQECELVSEGTGDGKGDAMGAMR